MLVERAGGAARFAWEDFFFAEHHKCCTMFGSPYERPKDFECPSDGRYVLHLVAVSEPGVWE
jgi:hypothetical protein